MKLLTSVCGVVLSLSIVCMAKGQYKDENKKELENLQGVWRVVTSQVGDEKTPEEELKKRKVTIKGNFLIYEFGNERKERREGTIKLDPKAKYLDWTASLPEAPTALAIYELNGNDLKIGFGNDGLVRPRRFVMGKDDVAWLLVLKRAARKNTADISQDSTQEPKKGRVIVLIDAATEGVAEGAKIKEIDLSEMGSKKDILDAKTKGQDRPRLNGSYVAKTCTISLADDKRLDKREVLVAIEVGKQTLRDFKYVETCEAKTEKGRGRWYAYTAEHEVK